MRVLVSVLALLLAWVQPVQAGTLDKRAYEMTLNLQRGDADRLGDTEGFNAAWLYIHSDGYIGLGGEITYLKIDNDDGSSANSWLLGPRLDINFTPKRRVTGFATLSMIFFSGGLAGDFQNGSSYGLGIKAFLLDRISVNALIGQQNWSGSRGTENDDVTFFSAGLSLYLGQE